MSYTWVPPLTAVTDDDFTENWEDGDSDRTKYVVRPLAVFADTVTIASTANENDLLTTDPTGNVSGVATLPGGWLGTKGMLRGTVMLDHLNSRGTGTTASLTFAVKLGGTTVWTDATDRFASDPHRHDIEVRFFVANCGSASSQFSTGYIKFGEPETGDGGGLGKIETTAWAISGPAILPFGSNGKTTVDTSVDQTVRLTIQHQFGDPNMVTRMQWGAIELVAQTA